MDQHPDPIRLSSGSAALLGLKNTKIRSKTKTIYLMNTGGCEFNCSFCAQAKTSSSDEQKLSRVSWPEYHWDQVLDLLEQNHEAYKRVCMQVVNTPNIFEELPKRVKKLREKNQKTKIAMTVRTRKMSDIDALFEAGSDEVGLSIDAIDPQQFSKIKGGSFEAHKRFILQAADKYPGKIATHIIVGMGETEQQAVELMEELHQHQIIIALFAFTPVKGARMEFHEPPSLSSYHRIQVALHLIRNNLPHRFGYDTEGRITSFGHHQEGLFEMLKHSNAFETSGCSDCNRPYYNERAGAKELYNYPHQLRESEFTQAFETLFDFQSAAKGSSCSLLPVLN